MEVINKASLYAELEELCKKTQTDFLKGVQDLPSIQRLSDGNVDSTLAGSSTLSDTKGLVQARTTTDTSQRTSAEEQGETRHIESSLQEQELPLPSTDIDLEAEEPSISDIENNFVTYMTHTWPLEIELRVELEECRTKLQEQEEQNSLLEERNSRLEEQKAQLEEREYQLKEKDVELGNKDDRLRDQETQLKERDMQLEELRARLEKQGDQLQEHHLISRQQGTLLSEQNDKLKGQNVQIKDLQRQLADEKGSIRVLIRIKPVMPTKPAIDKKELMNIRNPDQSSSSSWKTLQIVTEKDAMSHRGTISETKQFGPFERVFDDSCSNKNVFDEISDFTYSALDGRPVTLLAYGQTGSGKTHTFLNDDGKDDGIVLQYTDQVMKLGLEDPGEEFTFSLSAVEIYLGDIYDLLHGVASESKGKRPEKKKIDKYDERHWAPLDSPPRTRELITAVTSLRATAPTAGNSVSSRSHLLLALRIERSGAAEKEASKRSTSMVNFVDLAGSERPGETKAQGVAWKEGVDINQSLPEVISLIANASQGTPLPGGSHTLTKALSASFIPGARVAQVFTTSQQEIHRTATMNTLQIATKTLDAKIPRHIPTLPKKMQAPARRDSFSSVKKGVKKAVTGLVKGSKSGRDASSHVARQPL
ncbi:P-loop containing nucleoside triphosphate hydrolase protein [Xylariaceae sp. FL0255]|nr:P-loop containing nucleoside triphosphate hydrolase protein [Xylariaceae sp. FL0255]